MNAGARHDTQEWGVLGSGFFVLPGGDSLGEKLGPTHRVEWRRIVISATRLNQLQELIQSGREARFYDWPEWHAVRAEVLRMDRRECVRCREQKHRYRPARIVHHVRHLQDRPDLALSIVDPDTGARQLVSVCKDCHEELHPESLRRLPLRRTPLTAER